ncbi:hypothetical protein GN244_ATG04475 [Phytophthora infestans]|uniref:HTH psq-type domain-containing protein n=1 Tax=Phytophthora infestans TaxID=4787 RepID=A0A833WN67_PHYIN|nr:hypothetical protein GN244_ATG04475 [Phytophthora infestans]KAF4136279.1 hypothetical protein GN958_ATG14451 [Phytophthora infestans]
MAPYDHPHSSPSLLQGLPDSPLVRSEYHMYLHPRQPFVRYEERMNSRIPSQGHVDRLPGMASLLRRHNAMQANGLISSVRDPNYESDQRHSTVREYWTPPRQTASVSAAISPEPEWLSLTTTHKSGNRGTKSIEHISKTSLGGSKTSCPTLRVPERVRGLSESRPKTSRYLREIDRRRILMRIAQGEKQSALAKEYQVSRAAICNLNKHRAEVLSRNHEHPLAKHPKRRMLSKTKRLKTVNSQANEACTRPSL